MPAIEERVAFVEGRVVELGRGMTDLRDAIVSLERRMDERFAGVDRLFESVDRRFEAIDRRFEAIDRRFEAVDRRFEGIERRLDAIDHRIANQFLWVVGLQVTTIAAVFTAILAR